MPTYDYRCDACGHAFEAFQSFSDKPLKKCPGCKKQKLIRLIGAGAAVVFKGSGFYQTDYRSESYKSAAKADEAPAKPAETTASNTDTASKSSTTSNSATKSSKSGT